MSKRVFKKLSNSPYRVLLSEVLPFELPIHFTNHGFYQFIKESSFTLSFDGKSGSVQDLGPGTEGVLSIILGKSVKFAQTQNTSTPVPPLKNFVTESPYPDRANKNKWMLPYTYGIRHKRHDLRMLSIMHPASQLDVVNFYREFDASILYHSKNSNFSIRRPAKIAKTTVAKDNIFHKLSVSGFDNFEERGVEYDQYHSYFKYDRYAAIHKFFDSKEYLACERKFGYLSRVDVSKCFDNIYTHSISWSIYGKSTTKQFLGGGRDTKEFAFSFDKLLQNQNHGETNGILIGSEVSRIFAELILQGVDRNIELDLGRIGLKRRVDYEVLRYVDDFFIFLADASDESRVVSIVTDNLRQVKLNINSEKTIGESTPLMSLRSIAKCSIEDLIEDFFSTRFSSFYSDIRHDVSEVEDQHAIAKVKAAFEKLDFNRMYAGSSRPILAYKSVLYDTDVGHADLANYTLALIESEIENLLFQISSVRPFIPEHLTSRFGASLVFYLNEILDFAFFIYSGSPKVTPGIRLARIIATLMSYLRLSDFNKGLLDRIENKISTEILFQVRRQITGEFSTLEKLNLLQVARYTNPRYWPSETDLVHIFGLLENDDEECFDFPDNFGHLEITSILNFILDSKDYKKIRKSLFRLILRIYSVKDNTGFWEESETSLLTLDLLACPFIPKEIKSAVLGLYKIKDPKIVKGVLNICTGRSWFTEWNQSFDAYYRNLLMKRRQNVY